jgi:hypothetical protein
MTFCNSEKVFCLKQFLLLNKYLIESVNFLSTDIVTNIFSLLLLCFTHIIALAMYVFLFLLFISNKLP